MTGDRRLYEWITNLYKWRSHELISAAISYHNELDWRHVFRTLDWELTQLCLHRDKGDNMRSKIDVGTKNVNLIIKTRLNDDNPLSHA